MRKHFIHAFMGGNPHAFTHRLGELYRAHLVDRPQQQWDYFNANYRPAIYELDKRGEDALYQRGFTEEPVAEFKHVYNEFAHNVMLSDVLSQIELGAEQHTATVIFRPRVKMKASATLNGKTSSDDYYPDAAFSLTYSSGKTLKFIWAML